MNVINIQNQEVIVKSIVESNTLTVIPESENNVNVVQPITTVIEVSSPGPVGPTGPAGPSVPFTNTTGSIFSTTSSLLITGSLKNNVIDITPNNQLAILDCKLSNIFTLTLSSSVNTTITASNIESGQIINLQIIQPAISGTLTFSDQFKFPSISPYTASTINSAIDIISFITYNNLILCNTIVKNLI